MSRDEAHTTHMFGTGLHFLFAVYLPADVRLFLECFFHEPVVGPCLCDIYVICQQYRWNAFMEPFWVPSAVMIYLKNQESFCIGLYSY